MNQETSKTTEIDVLAIGTVEPPKAMNRGATRCVGKS